MTDDEAMLRRLRASSAGLPRDLAEWALELVEAAVAGARAEARDVQERNACLRRAGALVGGSTWARARALRDAIVGAPGAVPGVRALVAAAQESDAARPLPRSVRQLYRLLAS